MLLLESDTERRAVLADGLRAAGMRVVAVDRIGEVERWPMRDVVVTEADRFTRWWKQVGATHVVVLADTPEDGIAACLLGASLWLPRECSAGALLVALQSLDLNDPTRTAAPEPGAPDRGRVQAE